MSTTLSAADAVLTPGALAPDFTLATQNRGENWKLSDALAQSDVVLSFFPFAFTGVCASEMQCITNDLVRWQNKGAQAVGISCDSGPALKAWSEQLGLKHTLLSDLHRTVSKSYGLYWPEMNVAWRGTVVVARNGRVKWSQKREIPKAYSPDEVFAALA